MIGQLTAPEIEAILHEETICRLGLHFAGETYVVPITYAYDGGAIIGHSSDGRKLQMLRANPRVCIEVDRMEDLSNWQSVIAWGTFRECVGRPAMHAMETLMARVTPVGSAAIADASHAAMMNPHTGEHLTPAAMHATGAAVFRIVLEKKTGRYERAA
jgi:nitroimidazol reductase NimA-like FMN-containing flavoprotein (pyridoxamine 5'-phosphate oxidase superfamily)